MKPSCLICAGEVSPSCRSGDNSGKVESGQQVLGSGSNHLLEKQLRVIFLLKELLQVPGDKLGEYFKGWGTTGNPDSWIHLCGECVKSVDEAWIIYQQILGLNRKLAGVRGKVVTEIKAGCAKDVVSPQRGRGRGRRRCVKGGNYLAEDLRLFVNQMDYEALPVPPKNGDAQAMDMLQRKMDTLMNPGDLKDKEESFDELMDVLQGNDLGLYGPPDGDQFLDFSNSKTCEAENAEDASGDNQGMKKDDVEKSRTRSEGTPKRLEPGWWKEAWKEGYYKALETCSKKRNTSSTKTPTEKTGVDLENEADSDQDTSPNWEPSAEDITELKRNSAPLRSSRKCCGTILANRRNYIRHKLTRQMPDTNTLKPADQADHPVVKEEVTFEDDLMDFEDNLDSQDISLSAGYEEKPDTVSSRRSGRVRNTRDTVPDSGSVDQEKVNRKKQSLNDEGAILVNGKIRYKCIVPNCEAVLARRRNYIRHKRTVHRIRENDKWMPVRLRENAFRTSEGKLNFRCTYPNCDKVCKKYEDLKTHMKHVHLKVPYNKKPPPEGPLPCPQCGLTFPTHNRLYWHQRLVHRGGKVPVLSERDKQKMRERHKKNQSVVVQCPYCEYQGNRVNMHNHIRNKHEKNFTKTCEKCGKGFLHTVELRRHLADKHGLCPELECKDKSGFSNRKELRQHQISQHGKELDAFGCEECGEVFMTRTFLKRHLKIHEQDKKGGKQAGEYVCDLCGKQFALQDYLYFHKWSTHKVNKGKRTKTGSD